MHALGSRLPFRVGMVLIAAADDRAWGSAGAAGLRAIESRGLAEVSLRDRVPPSGWESAFDELVREGCGLVFGHGGELSESIHHAALAHPQTWFACLNGSRTADNLAVLEIDDAQLGFLAGVLAARVSPTGRVGFIGGLSIPPTLRQAEGFSRGARFAGSEALTAVTGSFDDPALARESALNLVKGGAGALYYYLNEAWRGVLQAGSEQGCRVIGSVVDRHADAPSVVCGSVLQHVDHVYLAALQLALAGRLSGQLYTFGLETGAGSLSPLYDVSGEIRKQMAELEQALAAGIILVSSMNL